MTKRDDHLSRPDFADTQVAFSHKTNRGLKETHRLFQLMNNGKLVDMGSMLAKLSLKMHLPFVKPIMKRTIFKQFCGGVSLMDCQEVIDHLYDNNTLTILDYGAEAKSDEEDLDLALEELLRAIEFAASNHSVPVVSSKLTALVANELLIKKQDGENFDSGEQKAYDRFLARIDAACRRAYELDVGIFIDAEESWMQDAMDEVVTDLMKQYNKTKVTVYNTYQLYRHDKLTQLRTDYLNAHKDGYLLGARAC